MFAGAGNLVSSFFPGTLPAYGAITRSKLNGDTGGRTQMASLITSTAVIFAVIFLLPALTYLPKCVLAAMQVVLRLMIDYRRLIVCSNVYLVSD